MNPLDWSIIDDYEFVKLVGDLVARQGFVDIDFQGDGPDGGIDLFASEVVAFSMRGQRPFRWAIQCKFSADGMKRAVNDADVRDVEGILRSERYINQRPQGYALITNRRISQNVIERLRGIDTLSPFRTATMDGDALATRLQDNPSIYSRYFGAGRRMLKHDGSPIFIATPSQDPLQRNLPTVTLEVCEPSTPPFTGRSVKIHAVVDTGASVTVLPTTSLDTLCLDHAPVGYDRLLAYGHTILAKRYLVGLRIDKYQIDHCTIMGAPIDHGVVGWDLLAGLTLVVEPSRSVRVYR